MTSVRAKSVPRYLSNPPWACDSAGKDSTCNEGDVGSIPGWKDPLERGKATNSSILAWRIQCVIHEIVKSRTQLSEFHFASPRYFWFLLPRGVATSVLWVEDKDAVHHPKMQRPASRIQKLSQLKMPLESSPRDFTIKCPLFQNCCCCC